MYHKTLKRFKAGKDKKMRETLLRLHEEYVGNTDPDDSDTELIVEILEILVHKIDNLENHTHNIS